VTLRERLARLNHLQQSLGFKIAATALVIVIALVLSVVFAMRLSEESKISPAPEARAVAPLPPDSDDPNAAAAQAILEDVMRARNDPVGLIALIGISTAVVTGAIWLGLGLTMLAICAAGVGLFFLALFTPWGRAYAPLGMGVLSLTWAFIVLMRLARLAVGRAEPVCAIARTVLAEAVRLRLSLFFIVMLIFLMAALPLLLKADTSLRYRVQQFLQYGVAGSYHLIAFLTVLFAVATVTFDQRDKTIWQTITKPVAPWQYILGKFLGVWLLSGVLLAVTGAGVFLFVEYLRAQPAEGERQAYLVEGGRGVSDDRFLLERLVLVAREARDADPLVLDEAQLQRNIEYRVREEIERRRAALDEEGARRLEYEATALKLGDEVRKSIQIYHRTIAPGETRVYTFSGLSEARASNRPIFLRYKINSGSNDPTALYRVTFQIGASDAEVREVVLGQPQILPLLPQAIEEDGRLTLRVTNADVYQRVTNAEAFTFPPDGLEVSFAAGSYRANFLRVFAVLWLKLAFLAMLGVCLGTFLSFPVACLVAVTIFYSAEGSTFLRASLENYWTEDKEGKTLYFNTVVAAIAKGISWFFQSYGDLRPTQKLVEGLRLTWDSVARGGVMVLFMTATLYLAGVGALRRRELAIYSGH
jgi:hypothetical protein